MDNEKKIKDNKDFWDVDKSVKRLIWRLSPKENGQYYKFEPNQNDFNALKSLLGSLDRDKKINVANNVLFAKLYIYDLTMRIRYFGTTVLDNYPVQDLNRMLSKPLSMFYKSFHKDLQDNQLNKLLDTENEKEQKEILKEYERLKKTFTLEFVSSKLDDMINKALKRFS
jgi:hypothetical protein